jgi:hypothetical protein
MPTANTAKGKAVPPPEVPEESDFVRLADFNNEVVIIEPIGHQTVMARGEEVDVIAALVSSWDGKRITFQGEGRVYWKRVKSQLDLLGPGEYTIGRIVRGDRSYGLEAVDAGIFETVSDHYAALD